jgi:hypothetical protein
MHHHPVQKSFIETETRHELTVSRTQVRDHEVVGRIKGVRENLEGELRGSRLAGSGCFESQELD